MTIRKILSQLCLGPILLFVACSPEETSQPFSTDDAKAVILYTGSKGNGNPSTRTTINEMGDVFWSTTDAIFVNGSSSSKTVVSNGGAYAEFSVNTSAPYSAVYPTSMVVDYSPYKDGWLYKLVLPETQPYKNTITFADGVNPSIAYSMNENLTFQNLCGILQVQIKANFTGVRSIRLASEDQYISGLSNVYVDGSSDAQSLQITDGKKTVDVVFEFDRTFSEYVPINISWVLPVGSYESGCTILLLDSENKVLSRKTLDSFTIVRSKRTNLGELSFLETNEVILKR